MEQRRKEILRTKLKPLFATHTYEEIFARTSNAKV